MFPALRYARGLGWLATLALWIWIAATGRAFALPIDGTDPSVRGLIPHMTYWRDSEGQSDLATARLALESGQFAPLSGENANFGMTPDTIWYHVTLDNMSSDSQSLYRVLEFEYVLLDQMAVHFVFSDGKHEFHRAGNGIVPEAGEASLRNFAFDIALEPQESVEIFASVRSDTSHQVAANLWTQNAFATHLSRESLWFGLFYGGLLSLLIYNLFVAGMVRDVTYVYYVGYLVSSLAFYLILNGFVRIFFDGGLGSQNLWIVPATLGLMALSTGEFVRAFLKTRETLPIIDRMIRTVRAIAVVATLATPTMPTMTATALLSIVGISMMLMGFIAGTVELLKGVKIARFFVLAWGAFFAGATAKFAATFGWISGDFWSIYGMQIGTAIEATLLSLALTHRLHSLRRFVPGNVARLALDPENARHLSPSRRMVVICAVDLRGFTRFAANERPETVIQVLKDYYQDIGDLAQAYGGTVESFAGDGMVIFFNAPIEIDAPERQACQAALAMQAAFVQRQRGWPPGAQDLGMGVGLARGEATAGAIGFANQVQYSAIGPVTNLAARLCSDARHGEILVDEALAKHLPDVIARETAGKREYKGLSQAIDVWRITGERE